MDEITLGESDMMPTTLSDEMPSEKLVTPKRMNLDIDKEPTVKCEVEKDFQAEGKKAKKKEGKKEKAKRETTQNDMLYSNVDGCSFIYQCVFTAMRDIDKWFTDSSPCFSEMDQNEEKETEKEKDKEKKPKKKDKGKDSEDPQKINKTAKQERKSKMNAQITSHQYSLQNIHIWLLYYITIV